MSRKSYSVRLEHALKLLEVKRIEDAAKLPVKEILKAKNVGIECVLELCSVLDKHGVCFEDQAGLEKCRKKHEERKARVLYYNILSKLDYTLHRTIKNRKLVLRLQFPKNFLYPENFYMVALQCVVRAVKETSSFIKFLDMGVAPKIDLTQKEVSYSLCDVCFIKFVLAKYIEGLLGMRIECDEFIYSKKYKGNVIRLWFPDIYPNNYSLRGGGVNMDVLQKIKTKLSKIVIVDEFLRNFFVEIPSPEYVRSARYVVNIDMDSLMALLLRKSMFQDTVNLLFDVTIVQDNMQQEVISRAKNT